MPLAQCVLSAFNILLSLSALRDEYQFPFDFLVSVFDSATERDAAEADTRMVYLAERGGSNAMRFTSRRDKEEKSLKSTAELLGVNLDRIQTALKQEGKGFADLKGNCVQLNTIYEKYFTLLKENIQLNNISLRYEFHCYPYFEHEPSGKSLFAPQSPFEGMGNDLLSL